MGRQEKKVERQGENVWSLLLFLAAALEQGREKA